MPELDLDKDRYRVRTRSGRWIVRDKPWQFAYGAAIAIGLVGFIWWHRAEIPVVTMLLVIGMICFFAGMLFAVWIKRFD